MIVLISLTALLSLVFNSCKQDKTADKQDDKTKIENNNTEKATATPTNTIEPLNANEFEKLLKEENDKLVLDVRTEFEYQIGHLANAQNIDFYNADFIEKLNELDKNKPCFVYCQSGQRSDAAAKLMKESGFKTLFTLSGGFNMWKSGSKEIVN